MSKQFSLQEVSRHNKEHDCWIIIDNKVYDVTNFLSIHPGGKRVIIPYAGKDASKVFHSFHAPSVLLKYGKDLCIGEVGTSAKQTGGDTFGDVTFFVICVTLNR